MNHKTSILSNVKFPAPLAPADPGEKGARASCVDTDARGRGGVSATIKLLSLLSMMMLVVAVVGCGKPSADGEYEKVEHFVPAHWPSDLLDASAKIAVRTSRLSGQSTAAENQAISAADPTLDPWTADIAIVENQLRDIVGWVPEIAADTDLTEEQWNPVYDASEKLSKRFAKMPRPLDDGTLAAIDEYCKLLASTASLLPSEEIEESAEESQ